MNRFLTYFGALLPLLLVGSEIAARAVPELQHSAAIAWIAISGILLLACLAEFILAHYRGGRPLSLLFAYSCIAGSLFIATDSRFVQHETTQQVGCALRKFAQPDFGFLSWCFLGYPTRGYYLGSFLSLFYEPSPFVLNVGQHFLLYGGILVFTAGVLRLIPSWKGDLFALFGVLAALSSPHIPYLLKNFEQSSWPTCLSLIFTGFLLLYVRDKRPWHLGFATVAAILAAFTYTPALALSAMAFFLLCIITLAHRSIVAGLCAASLATLTFLSLSIRDDLRLKPRDEATDVFDLFATVKRHTLSITENHFAEPLTLIVLTVLVVLGVWHWTRSRAPGQPTMSSSAFWVSSVLAATVCWTVLTAIISVRSSGYSPPSSAFALHRASLTLPLLTGVALWFFTITTQPRLLPTLMVAAAIPFIALSIANRFELLFRQQPTNLNYHMLKIIREAQRGRRSPDRLFMESSVGEPFMSIMNYNDYFSALDFFESIDRCEQLLRPDNPPTLLLLRKKGSGFCQTSGDLRCRDINLPSRPELEMCDLTNLSIPGN